jgi:hypothetical protein
MQAGTYTVTGSDDQLQHEWLDRLGGALQPDALDVVPGDGSAPDDDARPEAASTRRLPSWPMIASGVGLCLAVLSVPPGNAPREEREPQSLTPQVLGWQAKQPDVVGPAEAPQTAPSLGYRGVVPSRPVEPVLEPAPPVENTQPVIAADPPPQEKRDLAQRLNTRIGALRGRSSAPVAAPPADPPIAGAGIAVPEPSWGLRAIADAPPRIANLPAVEAVKPPPLPIAAADLPVARSPAKPPAIKTERQIIPASSRQAQQAPARPKARPAPATNDSATSDAIWNEKVFERPKN